MRILITGNMGYVGPAVVAHLRDQYPDCELLGFDSGLFAGNLSTAGPMPETRLNAQHFGDVRDLPAELLHGVTAIVHLAAISNDPMGNRFEVATDEINRIASVRLARLASEAGVRSFVFASSCSVYGFAESGARREDDALNPLTAYARSKAMTEEALSQMEPRGMTVTSLRFATACGMSERVRLDLVLNDFVACSLASGEITVLSDGTPWRPLIDIRDMARAIEWAILRVPEHGGPVLKINVGDDAGNHRVKDLAGAVAAAVPGTSVSINTAAPADSRSYRVDFSLYRQLAPNHQPRIDLRQSIDALVSGLRDLGFADQDFRESDKIRLKTLSQLVATKRLTTDLRWIPARTVATNSLVRQPA
jgi:nucleoside-diphosphate-sugar epimerase